MSVEDLPFHRIVSAGGGWGVGRGGKRTPSECRKNFQPKRGGIDQIIILISEKKGGLLTERDEKERKKKKKKA